MHHGAGAAPQRASNAMTNGVVKKVDKAAGSVTIAHEPLTNLGMPAMTMTFLVQDRAWLNGMKEGARIRFVANNVKGELTVVAVEQRSQAAPERRDIAARQTAPRRQSIAAPAKLADSPTPRRRQECELESKNCIARRGRWAARASRCRRIGDRPGEPSLGANVESLLEYARSNPEYAAMRYEADAADQRVYPAGALADPMFKIELQNITNAGTDAPPSLSRARWAAPSTRCGNRSLSRASAISSATLRRPTPSRRKDGWP